MTRPTVRDVALEANVSISTVNRVLSGSKSVKDDTILKVREAAVRVGYYSLGTINAQIASRKPWVKLSFVLHQPKRTVYKLLGSALTEAAKANGEYDVEA